MKPLFTDGFKGYTDAEDVGQNWTFGKNPVLIHTSAELSEVRSSSHKPEGILTRDIPSHSRVGLSINVRLPAANGRAIIGFSPAGYADRNRSESGESPKGLYLDINGLTPRLYYDILTGPSGSDVNSLMIGYSDEMLEVDQTHHIEMIVDHSDAFASCRVYINGELKIHNGGYDRDRILSGFQATEFGEVVLHTSGTFASSIPYASHVVAYDPEASNAAPQGSLKVKYLVTPEATLGVTPARDTNGQTITDNAWRDFDLSDVDPTAEIVSAELVYRIAAVDGQNPAFAELALESFGVQVGDTAQHIITPGYGPKIQRLEIPSSRLGPATINGMTLKVRSVAQEDQ